MADPKVKLKRSAVAGRIPSPDQVPLGELALNTWDGQLYASRNVGVGTSVVAINPWIVGTGTDSYNIYYTAGNAGIGTTIPRNELHVNGDIKIDRHLNVTGIVTASSFVGTLTGTATGLSGTPGIAVTNVTGFGFLRAPHSATTTVFKVTVASKDATHRYNGTGSGNGYLIDGVQSPFLTLTPGRTYRFDQSDSSNSSHPLRFYLEVGKTTQYSTNVTTNGTAGSAGAYTEITVTDTTPSVLHYQCTAHANMGNAIFVSSNALTSPHAATIKNYLTVDSGANLSGVTTLTTATATSVVVGSAVTLNSGGVVAGLGTFNSFRTTQLSVSGIATVTSGGVLGNIQVGKTGANEIDTSSGGLTIDSNGGVVTVDDYLGVNQGLSVTGISTLGHTIAGSAVTMTSGGIVAGLGTINYVDATHLNATGVVTANSFVGDGSQLTGITGGVFATNQTGINTSTNIGIGTTSAFNALQVIGDANISGVVTANSFVGDGSGLTGVTGTGSGIAVKDGGSTVGTAGTVDFGTALSVTPLSVGIVTVNLADTAVTAGDYTNADITVDAQGRITAASNGSGGGGSGTGFFVQNQTGIHTIGNVGIGTTTANGAADSNNTTILNAGIVTANYFYGDGSNITGVVAASSGIIIRDSNNLVGTAATVNFGTGLSVTPVSAGIVTVSNLAKTSGVDRTETSFTATAGQTTFTVSYDILNPIDVFLNGIRLKDTTDYTATNGTSIVLTSSAAAGDSLIVMEYFATTGVTNEKHSVDRKVTEFTATAGQTTFSVTYTAGNIDVFFNGVRLLDSDVTASNGTSVVLGSAAAAGDQVVVVEYIVTTTGSGITGQTVTQFTATAGQTAFSVSYIIGAIQVYRNGVRLVEDSDYTANTGTSVVLTSGASVDDSIVVVESLGLFDNNQTGIVTTSNLGIGTTSAYNALTVVGDANISGVLTATTLYGNGANLTGIQAGFFVQNQTGIHTTANIGIGTTSAFDALSVTGDANITGVVTATSFTGDIVGDTDITGNVTIISTDAGSSAEPELKLYRNSASPADADYLGQIKFAGESDTGVERNYAKITGKILDASNGTEDGIIEFAHIKAGSQTITARFRSDSLQLLNSTSLTVNGNSTFTGNILAASDSTVDIGTNSTRFANVYADTYYGDGSNLTGVTAEGGIGIGLSTYNVGYAQTTIEFIGAGITVVSIGNTTQVTIDEPGLVGAAKSVTSFTATAGQTAFNVDHSTGQENVFLNGVRLSESQYTTNGSTITLNDAAALGDILDIVVYLRGSDANRNIEVNLRPPFNGVTTAFTMYRGTSDVRFDPVDARQILVSLGGVVQHPGIAYTVGAGSSIYFASAPGAGNTCFITGLFSTQSGISTDATKIETQVYSPTGVQTSFTLTRGYEQNYLDVYVNGARLVSGQDYTATDSSTFSLTSPASAGDTVEAVAFRTVGITSAVTAGISSNVDGNYVNTTHLRTSGISTFGGVGIAATQTITVYSGVGVGQTYVGLFIGASKPDDTQVEPALYVKESSQGLTAIFDGATTEGGYIDFRTQGTTIGDVGSAAQVIGSPQGDKNHFAINARSDRPLIFGTYNTERMRILSGGNIGIGTTNPEQKLHVAGNLTLGDPNGGNNTYIDQKENGHLEIVNSGRNANNGSVRINRYNDTGSDTTYFRDFNVYNGKNGLVLQVDGSTGWVGVNTTAPSHTTYAKFFVQGSQKGISIRDDSGVYRAIYMNSSGNLYFYNGSNEGYLSNTGAWTNASDERLKQNIRPIGYGLTTALSLTPRHYEMIEGGETNIGFIAQEVEEIVPEVVSSSDSATGYKGLDYGSLVAIAIKSIQELKEQNDAYLARIQALEAQVGIAST